MSTDARASHAADLTPAPGRAPAWRMLRAQAGVELRLTAGNAEQLLLNLVIPVTLLVVLVLVPFVDVGGGSRAGFVVPGVLALAVMSAAFTGQAIAVGFERQYGVLKRLGATALPRWSLVLAKTVAVLIVEAVQLLVLAGVGLALGWRPHGSPAAVLLLVVLGTAAFSGLGLLLGGTLRGLTALAAANLAWFALLLLGGVLFPLRYLGEAEPVARWLPTAALADGLRAVLRDGHPLPGGDTVALAGWALAALAAAAAAFRWE